MSTNAPRRPVVIIVAGPNGSGKTTLTTEVLEHEWIKGCVYINPDNIAQEQFGGWNSKDSVIAAANYAEGLRNECVSKGQSFAFETVLSRPDKIDFLRKAKEAGFFIRLFFVGTDHPSINASRITYRVMAGGHTVDIRSIIERWQRSIAQSIAAAAFADRAYFYDNSVDGVAPKLMFRTVDGEIRKIYTEIRPWAEAIMDSLPSDRQFTDQEDLDSEIGTPTP